MLHPKGTIQAVQSGTLWQLQDEAGFLAFEDTPIELPSLSWCHAIIAEWQKPQKKTEFNLKPDRPATQVAQLALLGTSLEPEKYQQQLLDYLATDTLLFWQQQPSGLMQAQQTHWQPILRWIKDRFGDCPEPCYGLHPAIISEHLQETLRDWLRQSNPYRLAGLVFLAGITGSIMLSTAFAAQFIDAETAYKAACMEALYQRERWGADAEGDARLDRVHKSCILAADFLHIEPERS